MLTPGMWDSDILPQLLKPHMNPQGLVAGVPWPHWPPLLCAPWAGMQGEQTCSAPASVVLDGTGELQLSQLFTGASAGERTSTITFTPEPHSGAAALPVQRSSESCSEPPLVSGRCSSKTAVPLPSTALDAVWWVPAHPCLLPLFGYSPLLICPQLTLLWGAGEGSLLLISSFYLSPPTPSQSTPRNISLLGQLI